MIALPPLVEGERYGTVQLVFKKLVLFQDRLKTNAILKFVWWGQQGEENVVPISTKMHESSTISFPVVVHRKVIEDYFYDMNKLHVEVLDSANRLIGNFSVSLRKVVENDLKHDTTIDIKARQRGSSALKKIGQINVSFLSQFKVIEKNIDNGHTSIRDHSKSSGISTFQQTEALVYTDASNKYPEWPQGQKMDIPLVASSLSNSNSPAIVVTHEPKIQRKRTILDRLSTTSSQLERLSQQNFNIGLDESRSTDQHIEPLSSAHDEILTDAQYNPSNVSNFISEKISDMSGEVRGSSRKVESSLIHSFLTKAESLLSEMDASLTTTNHVDIKMPKSYQDSQIPRDNCKVSFDVQSVYTSNIAGTTSEQSAIECLLNGLPEVIDEPEEITDDMLNQFLAEGGDPPSQIQYPAFYKSALACMNRLPKIQCLRIDILQLTIFDVELSIRKQNAFIGIEVPFLSLSSDTCSQSPGKAEGFVQSRKHLPLIPLPELANKKVLANDLSSSKSGIGSNSKYPVNFHSYWKDFFVGTSAINQGIEIPINIDQFLLEEWTSKTDREYITIDLLSSVLPSTSKKDKCELSSFAKSRISLSSLLQSPSLDHVVSLPLFRNQQTFEAVVKRLSKLARGPPLSGLLQLSKDPSSHVQIGSITVRLRLLESATLHQEKVVAEHSVPESTKPNSFFANISRYSNGFQASRSSTFEEDLENRKQLLLSSSYFAIKPSSLDDALNFVPTESVCDRPSIEANVVNSSHLHPENSIILSEVKYAPTTNNITTLPNKKSSFLTLKQASSSSYVLFWFHSISLSNLSSAENINSISISYRISSRLEDKLRIPVDKLSNDACQLEESITLSRIYPYTSIFSKRFGFEFFSEYYASTGKSPFLLGRIASLGCPCSSPDEFTTGRLIDIMDETANTSIGNFRVSWAIFDSKNDAITYRNNLQEDIIIPERARTHDRDINTSDFDVDHAMEDISMDKCPSESFLSVAVAEIDENTRNEIEHDYLVDRSGSSSQNSNNGFYVIPSEVSNVVNDYETILDDPDIVRGDLLDHTNEVDMSSLLELCGYRIVDINFDNLFENPSSSKMPYFSSMGCYIRIALPSILQKSLVVTDDKDPRLLWWDSECIVLNGSSRLYFQILPEYLDPDSDWEIKFELLSESADLSIPSAVDIVPFDMAFISSVDVKDLFLKSGIHRTFNLSSVQSRIDVFVSISHRLLPRALESRDNDGEDQDQKLVMQSSRIVDAIIDLPVSSLDVHDKVLFWSVFVQQAKHFHFDNSVNKTDYYVYCTGEWDFDSSENLVSPLHMLWNNGTPSSALFFSCGVLSRPVVNAFPKLKLSGKLDICSGNISHALEKTGFRITFYARPTLYVPNLYSEHLLLSDNLPEFIDVENRQIHDLCLGTIWLDCCPLVWSSDENAGADLDGKISMKQQGWYHFWNSRWESQGQIQVSMSLSSVATEETTDTQYARDIVISSDATRDYLPENSLLSTSFENYERTFEFLDNEHITIESALEALKVAQWHINHLKDNDYSECDRQSRLDQTGFSLSDNSPEQDQHETMNCARASEHRELEDFPSILESSMESASLMSSSLFSPTVVDRDAMEALKSRSSKLVETNDSIFNLIEDGIDNNDSSNSVVEPFDNHFHGKTVYEFDGDDNNNKHGHYADIHPLYEETKSFLENQLKNDKELEEDPKLDQGDEGNRLFYRWEDESYHSNVGFNDSLSDSQELSPKDSAENCMDGINECGDVPDSCSSSRINRIDEVDAHSDGLVEDINNFSEVLHDWDIEHEVSLNEDPSCESPSYFLGSSSSSNNNNNNDDNDFVPLQDENLCECDNDDQRTGIHAGSFANDFDAMEFISDPMSNAIELVEENKIMWTNGRKGSFEDQYLSPKDYLRDILNENEEADEDFMEGSSNLSLQSSVTSDTLSSPCIVVLEQENALDQMDRSLEDGDESCDEKQNSNDVVEEHIEEADGLISDTQTISLNYRDSGHENMDHQCSLEKDEVVCSSTCDGYHDDSSENNDICTLHQENSINLEISSAHDVQFDSAHSQQDIANNQTSFPEAQQISTPKTEDFSISVIPNQGIFRHNSSRFPRVSQLVDDIMSISATRSQGGTNISSNQSVNSSQLICENSLQRRLASDREMNRVSRIMFGTVKEYSKHHGA